MEPEQKFPMLPFDPDQNGNIFSVAAGKGGTGKSFLAASLGIYFAQRDEKEVVLIDADLGGPNLHTFLGVKETEIDLGHFITNRIPTLQDTLAATPFKNLSLIKGTENVFFTANLNYNKKLKLLRHIKAFVDKSIIIDIGTGTAYNCIDFFLFSNPGLLVVNPEPTSVENAYYFLKNCIIRILKLVIDYYEIHDLMKKIADQITDTSKSIYSFLNEIISQDKFYAEIIYSSLQKFKPCLILNKTRSETDTFLGNTMAEVVQKYLVIDMDFIGSIPFDDRIHTSIKEYKPFLQQYPDSEVARSIRSIADKLIEKNRL
ncbi:MAG: MinD/ParA family protein [Candidatus Aminicenantes bacterium]|nr:MinD/ParA family protein [Candidatus Aminicenantes bacterium]